MNSIGPLNQIIYFLRFFSIEIDFTGYNVITRQNVNTRVVKEMGIARGGIDPLERDEDGEGWGLKLGDGLFIPYAFPVYPHLSPIRSPF
jgi:hypothetical protein